ncbi:MAG: amidohydrolase family protein, partial [Acidimicrobiia bacterium]
MSENELPYMIMDADNHFTEPPTCFEQYIDPSKKDLAVRFVQDASGQRLQLFAGKPSKYNSKQTVYSAEALEKMLGQPLNELAGEGKSDESVNQLIPGMLLNRMNPLKGLTEAERKELVQKFRHQSEAYGSRDLRLALMTDQGIEAALMFPAAAHDIEYEFADNIEALYANVRAFNRWMLEEVGYNVENRMYLPPYIPMADPDLAVKEVERVIADGAPLIQFKSGHAHGGEHNPWGGRSIADPVYDGVWARINEAKIGVTIHLGGTDYQKYGADWSYDPEDTFGEFDAFQWMMYWGDRPAQEVTAAMILHNLFGRFPNVRVCLAEMGTVWVPYTLRKMDHAFMMGRKAKYGTLKQRPSEVFRQHFVIAPYPEENVARVVEVTGV